MKVRVICPHCNFKQEHKHISFPKEFEAIFNTANQTLQTIICIKCKMSFKYRIKNENNRS